MANKKDINENINESDKVFRKVVLSWYPGHMAKTKKEIIEDLKLVDIVIEILDSRIPISSQNPDITELTKNKAKIIVLNKADLSDKKENELWVRYFKEQGQRAVLVNSSTGQGINDVILEIEKINIDKKDSDIQKGRVGRKVKAIVLGIPNVGKSSFINKVSKNTKMAVANKPGVTKKKQWIRINDKVDLLDTAGILWPKIDNEKVGLNLSFVGTIKDDILPITEVSYELLKFLLKNYRENIIERYKITNEYIENTLSKDNPENMNVYEIMQEIGRKRGCIMSRWND